MKKLLYEKHVLREKIKNYVKCMPKVFEKFEYKARKGKPFFLERKEDTLHFTSHNKLSGILVNSLDNIRKEEQKKLNFKR